MGGAGTPWRVGFTKNACRSLYHDYYGETRPAVWRGIERAHARPHSSTTGAFGESEKMPPAYSGADRPRSVVVGTSGS